MNKFILVLACAVCLNFVAQAQMPIYNNGPGGDNGNTPSNWTLSGGTLEISAGYVNVDYWSNSLDKPWNSNAFSITKIVITGDIEVGASLRGLFSGLPNLTDIEGLEKLNTANVTNMSSVFMNSPNLLSLDLSNWKTSNVLDMSYMFAHTGTVGSGLINLDLSAWDTSNVTDMSYMFNSSARLATLNVSTWDTGNVITMAGMFSHAMSLININLSNWDTSNVTSMLDMFNTANSLPSLDIANWDTGSVVYMSSMFYNASALTALDIANWDTGNVLNMSNMFAYASALTALDVPNWNTGNVLNMSDMFSRASALVTLDVSNWNTSNVMDMGGMFFSASSLVALDLSNWDVSSVTNMSGIFAGASSLTTLDVSTWDTSNVVNLSYVFMNTTSLAEIDVSNWNTSNATTMIQTFHNATVSPLTKLDLTSWDSNKVINMTNIFGGTSNMWEITVGGNFRTVGSNYLIDVLPANGGTWRNVETGETRTSFELWTYLLTTRAETQTWRWSVVIDAEEPILSTNPVSATYEQDETAVALSVTATVADGGTLSYQWYRDGVIIAGATSSTYTPSTAAVGTADYHVVITNNNSTVHAFANPTASITSSIARIIIIIVPIVPPIPPDPPTCIQLADAVNIHWNNTLIIKNDSRFANLTYVWYRNGSEQARGGYYYSVDPASGNEIRESDTFEVRFQDAGGNVQFRTCPTNIKRSNLSFGVYPNPAGRSSVIKVATQAPQGSNISVYDIRSNRIANYLVEAHVTEIPTPTVSGAYIIVIRCSEGLTEEYRVIVE
jgi:surface protein